MQIKAKFNSQQYLAFAKRQMTSCSHILNSTEIKTSECIIDPVFLIQMELLAVKLLKLKHEKSPQIPTLEHDPQNSMNTSYLNAKLTLTSQGAQSISKNTEILQLLDPQFFVNNYSPSYPQTVQVYMIFNRNKHGSRAPFRQEESKINNNTANQSPTIPLPSIYAPCQVSKDAQIQAEKVSYNPNEPGLHYLKGTNNHPQTSTVQVDGEKRIIVQIKRDSNKMSNTFENAQNTVNQQSQGQVNQVHSSSPTYEGWDHNDQNGNHLGSGQNFMNQGNAQPIYQTNLNQPLNPCERVQNGHQKQNFSLVQKNTEQLQNSQRYFSFGKNTHLCSKAYNTPFKIQESNKEESSENNEDSQFKRSDVMSYKRANVGDPLPMKNQLKDNFNKLVSQRQERDDEEREEIERKKIEKRKKETRKLLLGEEDSDEGKPNLGTPIMPSVQTRYYLDAQIRPNIVQNRSLITEPYATHVIPFSGLIQNNQNSSGSGQVQYGGQSNVNFSHSENNPINLVQNQGPNESMPTSIFESKGILIQNKQTNTLVNGQELKTTVNFSPQDKTILDCSNQFYSPHQSQSPPLHQQSYTIPSTQLHSTQTNQMVHYHQYPSKFMTIQPIGTSQNDTFPIITPNQIFQFFYYKELHRQQNEMNFQPHKDLKTNKTISFSQRQQCSSQNFDELFQQFQQLISPCQHNPNTEQNQPQLQGSHSFDAISQRIDAKLFSHQDIRQNRNQGNNLNEENEEKDKDKKWALDQNLPIRVFLSLMYKYELKLNKKLIDEAQALIGHNGSSQKNDLTGSFLSRQLYFQGKPITSGLIDHIEQISNGSLNRILKQIHSQVHNQLTQIYFSIPKISNGIKINPQTGNVEYPKKQQLCTSDLSLYQYVQNCMINYDQIVNDPLYSFYNYGQVISDSLKKLIWIKQLDHSHTRIASNYPHFKQILHNTQSQNQQSQPNACQDLPKMTQFIINYLDQLEYFSLELDEKVNLILYDLSKIDYKPSATFADCQSKQNSIFNVYPHSFIDQSFQSKLKYSQNTQQTTQTQHSNQFYSDNYQAQPFDELKVCANLPNNYLNELREALSFTRNVEKELSSYQMEARQSEQLQKELLESLKIHNHCGQNKVPTEMVDQTKIDKINQFVSTMINFLSGIEQNLEIMNHQLFTNISY